ncbi:hypothetical protein ZWY2020_047692 [Hordeum vulgare]|nr:hypothetical protein ZWY2020_047692 [Hordeum vulgare]
MRRLSSSQASPSLSTPLEAPTLRCWASLNLSPASVLLCLPALRLRCIQPWTTMTYVVASKTFASTALATTPTTTRCLLMLLHPQSPLRLHLQPLSSSPHHASSRCARRFHADAVHNPSGIIRQALQAVGGNPAFAIGGSWRGEACLTFSSHLERERVLSRGLLNYEGNVLFIEPVEDAERCIAVFDELIGLEAVGIPHELWHDAGVKFVLNHFGDVCSVDQYCMQGDYTSVRALVMVAAGLPTPESHDVKSVALKVMQRWTHGVNANPFAGSSEESITMSSARSYRRTGPESTYPLAPPPSPSPPSPTPTSAAVGPVDTTSPPPADTSADAAAPTTIFAPTPTRHETSVHLPPLLTPLPPSAAVPSGAMADNRASVVYAASTMANVALPSGGSAFVPLAPLAPTSATRPQASKTTAFTFGASSSRAPPLPVNDLDLHVLHINKASVAAKRARRSSDKEKRSTDLLRWSDRLARQEPRVHTSITDRASKAKAARLGDGDPAKSFLDALHDTALDDPAAPPATPATLALLAKLCGCRGLNVTFDDERRFSFTVASPAIAALIASFGDFIRPGILLRFPNHGSCSMPPPPTAPRSLPQTTSGTRSFDPAKSPRRFAFAHLRDAVHNPSGIIRQALQAVGGNPAFAIGGSWRGEACLTFSSHLERERVLSLGLLNYEGNVLSIEPVEDAERCIAVFDELIELEAVGIPHELWHDAGVKFVLNHFGDVCSVDQYCMQGDYTSVRALVMVAAGLPTPESMIIRLPVSHDVKFVALKVMQRWTHGVNANPFAGSSEDSISSARSSSRSYPAGGWTGPESTYLPAPPPSPSPPSRTPTSAAIGPVDTTSPPPADTSADAAAPTNIFAPTPTRHETFVHLPPLLTPLPPVLFLRRHGDNRSFVVYAADHGQRGFPSVARRCSARRATSACRPQASKTTAFTFGASSSRAPPLPVNDLDLHVLHINKASVAAKRACRSSDKGKRSTDLLRRSDRLARQEPRVYTSIADRASKAKAARLGDGDPAKSFLDALHDTALDDPAAPPATPAALALLAKLCAADSEQAESVRNAEAGDDHIRIDVRDGEDVEDGDDEDTP